MSNPLKQKHIRITDLGNPQLNKMQQGAVDLFEENPVELSVEAVLSKAVKDTGLDDFGKDDFKPRLALWLSSVNTAFFLIVCVTQKPDLGLKIL